MGVRYRTLWRSSLFASQRPATLVLHLPESVSLQAQLPPCFCQHKALLSFQALSVSRRMEMKNEDLGSTFTEVKSDLECKTSSISELWVYILTESQQVSCLEGRYHFSIRFQELMKMMEEMEKAIIKEKNGILEESKQIIEHDKLMKGMQKKIYQFLRVESLKQVEIQQGEKVDDCSSLSTQKIPMVKQTQKSMSGYPKKVYSCTRNCLWLFGRSLKLSIRCSIGVLLYYKCLPDLVWLCHQMNSIFQQYLTCEHPF
eukprot:XP_015137172.2 uncharacterized protein LOC420734 isoform X2 [Gallus gallus]